MGKTKDAGVADLPPSSNSAAPGQYLGFSLQQLRLCHHLLGAAEDSRVSIEVTDDVSVHLSNGDMLLEQCKSALSGNPISNGAVDLWKAFASWGELCISKHVDPKHCVFRLYVTPLKKGTLVATMHAARSKETAEKVLTNLKKLLKKQLPSVGCEPMLAKFLAAGDAICLGIIEHFELKSEHEPLESIRERLIATVKPDLLDRFCAAAIGIARGRVDKLIGDGNPAVVQTSQYRREWRSFIRKYDMGGLLLSMAPEPTPTDITAIVTMSPLFVRQLKVIEAADPLISVAISDYLRTTADKINWAADGNIVSNSLDELDASLERRYVLAKDEVEDTFSSSDEASRGRQLYRMCRDTNFSLEQRELPNHFVSGAYNCLADERRLGWHPKYEDLFPSD